MSSFISPFGKIYGDGINSIKILLNETTQVTSDKALAKLEGKLTQLSAEIFNIVKEVKSIRETA